MQPRRILIVEDERDLAELLLVNLRHQGFAPFWAGEAEAAQREIEAELPALVVLDWGLPATSGLDLVRRWRGADRSRALPIVMLTARGDECDKLAALEAGVDDYVTKPFSVNELLARIRAVLRRAAPGENLEALSLDALVLDPAAHRVAWKGFPLQVGPSEFRMLHFLMRWPERVHSRRDLLRGLWGTQSVEERTVDVYVKRLREALGPAGDMVETVRGVGYRLTARPMQAACHRGVTVRVQH